MMKVRTFGAITKIISPLVIICLYGLIEKVFCFFDLGTDPGKIYQPERCTIFFNQVID
jgi:hypothetical protein